jgi:RNA polymerase sigma-70 factor (ECF subfamily)
MEKQIEKLYRPLFLYINKRINNTLDSEDLTQEVFYKLSRSKNDNVHNIKSWVYTIAKNAIIDYYRKKKHYTEDVDNIEYKEELTEKEAINELSNCITPFINQLPADYQEVMKLSELENIPQKEIAARLDVNYTTVRSKIQRGRSKLKNLISGCCTVIQGGKGGIVGYEKNPNCDTDC